MVCSYVTVDNIDERWLLSRYGYGTAEAAPKLGDLFGATFSDFSAQMAGSFDVKISAHRSKAVTATTASTNRSRNEGEDKKDEENQKAALQRINETIAALHGDNPIAAAEKYFDVDQFLTFWALESIMGMYDSYAANNNNYMVYADPVKGGRFVFQTNGPDQGLGHALIGGMPAPPASLLANAVLP